MDSDGLKEWILIGLILLVGVFPPASFILIWFIKNIITPIGDIENLAWALDSPNPWVWVFRLMLLLIGGVITTGIIAWIKEKIGF